MSRKELSVYGLLGLSATLLGLGLGLPLMEVEPRLGPYHEYLAYFFKELGSTQKFSLLTGITHLFTDGHYFVGTMVLIFSVIFPLWKVQCLWLGMTRLNNPSRMFRFAEKFGKYSMVDVFVIALLVIAIKGLPGGSEVSLRAGLYCFAASILATLSSSWMIERYLLDV